MALVPVCTQQASLFASSRPSRIAQLASSFDLHFRKHTRGWRSNEIPLFRQLRYSLLAQTSGLDIEEYHGGGHQVAFRGNGSHARTGARCELSDLMVIIY